MARKFRRIIRRHPERSNYFLVDACFLVNKYLKQTWFKDPKEQECIRLCHDWWREVDAQVAAKRARVYVPDLCIGEAFKVLAKKNYQDRAFRFSTYYKKARDSLRGDVHLSAEDVRRQHRHIRFHNIETNSDMIIGIDRFFEKLHKLKVHVGIIDLMILSMGKCLMDFYGFTRANLFIVTTDEDLYKLARSYNDVPQAYNPLKQRDKASKVFVGSAF